MTPNDWSKGPLYQFLRDVFPTYRTVYDRFDVHRLCSDIGYSHEAIYKWLRNGRLSAKAVRHIMSVANTQELIALRGRKIEINEFNPFVYLI